MTIKANPILPDRKNLVQCIKESKQTEDYILTEPSEARIKGLPYDARTELDRVEYSLDWSLNSKPMFNFKAGNPEEEVARVDARTAEIKRAERQYKQRLLEAEKTGAITTSEAHRLLVDLSSPFPTNPFERARRDAEELYRKERKF